MPCVYLRLMDCMT